MIKEFQSIRPAGGFKVILADPATDFDNWSAKGKIKNPSAHYDTMTIDEIKAMPVETLAAEDCVLFLWSVWPLVPHWNEIIEAWGFQYKGLAWQWFKYNEDTGKHSFGLGYGTRKNLEPCLLATRGKPSLKREIRDMFGIKSAKGAKSVRDFLEACPDDSIVAKRREHSRKPDEQYTRIETMFDGPYCELFARQRRPGWSAWGNEVGKFTEAAE
ncbi:MAG: MT-A70 family methyltransferase [Sneathiella sp.]